MDLFIVVPRAPRVVAAAAEGLAARERWLITSSRAMIPKLVTTLEPP